jgi:hypothetical protein
VGLQLLENKALSWGIIRKSTCILAEIALRKIQGRNLCGVSARCTQQEDMEREQRTIAGTAEDGAHLSLLCQGHLQ